MKYCWQPPHLNQMTKAFEPYKIRNIYGYHIVVDTKYYNVSDLDFLIWAFEGKYSSFHALANQIILGWGQELFDTQVPEWCKDEWYCCILMIWLVWKRGYVYYWPPAKEIANQLCLSVEGMIKTCCNNLCWPL